MRMIIEIGKDSDGWECLLKSIDGCDISGFNGDKLDTVAQAKAFIDVASEILG